MPDDGRSQAGVGRNRVASIPLTVGDLVREADQVRVAVVQRHEHVVIREHGVDPLADQLGDRVEVELSLQGVANLVDDRQFGVALPDL